MKYIWEMTRDEFVEEQSRIHKKAGVPSNLIDNTSFINGQREYHREWVVIGLSEGRSIPKKVLKDYPDLTRRKR